MHLEALEGLEVSLPGALPLEEAAVRELASSWEAFRCGSFLGTKAAG
jgi:hypothetical protein